MAEHNEEAVNGKSDPIKWNKSKQNQTLVFWWEGQTGAPWEKALKNESINKLDTRRVPGCVLSVYCFTSKYHMIDVQLISSIVLLRDISTIK